MTLLCQSGLLSFGQGYLIPRVFNTDKEGPSREGVSTLRYFHDIWTTLVRWYRNRKVLVNTVSTSWVLLRTDYQIRLKNQNSAKFQKEKINTRKSYEVLANIWFSVRYLITLVDFLAKKVIFLIYLLLFLLLSLTHRLPHAALCKICRVKS